MPLMAWDKEKGKPNVSDFAIFGPLSVPAVAAAKVAPLIPRAASAVDDLATRIIRETNYLGFDTAAEAKRAILRYPDWAERWDVSGAMADVLNQWKNLVKSKKLTALRESDWDEAEDVLGPLDFSAPGNLWDHLKQVFSEARANEQRGAELARRSFQAIRGGKE